MGTICTRYYSFNEAVLTIYVLCKNKKNVTFLLKMFSFAAVKLQYILHRRDFIITFEPHHEKTGFWHMKKAQTSCAVTTGSAPLVLPLR